MEIRDSRDDGGLRIGEFEIQDSRKDRTWETPGPRSIHKSGNHQAGSVESMPRRASPNQVQKRGPKNEDEANRSHENQPLYSQWDTLETTKTKPRRPSSMVSMVYGHFDPVFSQVATDGATLYIADSGGWDGRQNKAKSKPSRLSYFESAR